jgi:hypothetical protein
VISPVGAITIARAPEVPKSIPSASMILIAWAKPIYVRVYVRAKNMQKKAPFVAEPQGVLSA